MYRLGILPRAQRGLAKLPSPWYERARDAIRALASDPRPAGCIKLTGRDGWRIRVGDYRVIYEIHDADAVVNVLDVGPRSDIYRRT